MPRQARTLIAEPDPPSGVWIYADADDEIYYECGRCGQWWFPSSLETPLEDEIRCGPCAAAKFAARASWQPPPRKDDARVTGSCRRCGRSSVPPSCLLCGGTGAP